MQLQLRNIRTQLTLWYIAIFSLLMGLYICCACSVQYWQLNDQLYHAEVQELETIEGLLYFTADGHLMLHEDYHSRPESKLLLDQLMEVLDSNGQVVFRNEKLHGVELGGRPVPHEWGVGYYARRLRLSNGIHTLAISHIHRLNGRPYLIRIAYSTEPLRLRYFELLGLLAVMLPIALIAAGFAGYRVAGKALNPLEEMARLTEQITANRLSDRIPIDNPDDELGHMARVLNGLLSRLEESFNKLQRFTSDVSHELRTPLASIRSVGEVGLQHSLEKEGYRDVIGSMLEEVSRLTSMVDTLLTIAHADSGSIRMCRAVFPLMDLVEESVGVVSVLAEDKKQTVSVDGDATISVSADRGFLRMAVINLLDNAVKYSPPGSVINVSLKTQEVKRRGRRVVQLSIEDDGPGIPANEMHRVFDRFYRVDEARTRDVGGAGLGLAIAKWAVEANGGTILLHAAPENGAVFTIQLPVA